MRERIVGGAALAAAAFMLVLAVVLSVGRDNKGPEIIIPSGLSYTDGQDVDSLLEGVKAVDARDGDVSNTLVVESMLVLGDGDRAKVTYIARDSSNNVSHADTIISYSGNGDNIYSTFSAADKDVETQQPETETEPVHQTVQETTAAEPVQQETTKPDNEDNSGSRENIEGESEKGSLSDVENKSDAENQSDDKTKSDGENESDSRLQAADEPEPSVEQTTANPGAPVLKLVQNEASINKGEQFKVFKFVESNTDDKDDRDYLYERINIDGQYDIYTAGDYEIYIFCTDSDRQQSNREKFILHVVE